MTHIQLNYTSLRVDLMCGANQQSRPSLALRAIGIVITMMALLVKIAALWIACRH